MRTRVCSRVLSAALALSLLGVSAAAADQTLTITGVTTDQTTSTSAATHVTAVTYTENGQAKTATAQTGVLTLVVDGVQQDISVGDSFAVKSGYSFTDTAVRKSGQGAPPWNGPDATKADYNFRQALLITPEGIDQDASVTDAISGTYDAASASGVSVSSSGAFFNGIYVTDAKYAIDNLTMKLVGDGGDDFSGWGAGVMADGNAGLTVDRAIIDTAGVIRTAIWAGGDAKLKVTNSVISANETQDTQAEYDALVVSMMKRTPFALGMEGVVRATNVLGAAEAVYEDSIVVSTGWGALSTDSGVGHDKTGAYALTARNTLGGIGTVEVAQAGKQYTLTKTVDGVTYGFTMAGSGYVAYADSGVWDLFDRVQFYSPDYVQIMASSTSSAYYTDSDLYSGRIAFMTQQNAGGTLSVKDSTVYAEDTLVQIKSGAANKGYTDVVIDNSQVTLGSTNPWSGTLLELVESDDAGNPGITTYTISDTGDTATHATSKGVINASNATFQNGVYTGNIWNNIYNYTQALNVTLDNATVNGSISSAYGYHTDKAGSRLPNGTVLTACAYPNYLDPTHGTNGDYLLIGAQYNVASPVVNNPVNLTLTNGGAWQVAGEHNYLSQLSADSLDAITAATPATVHVQSLTVDGKAYADGTYKNGNLTYVVKAAAVEDTNSDTLATTQDYSGLHAVTFKAVTESGLPASSAVTFDYHAFTYISFEVSAKDGHEVLSVTSSDPAALTGADGVYRLDNLSAAENTVTVTVRDSATAASPPVTPVTPTAPSGGQSTVYVVQAGDTLWAIAKKTLGSGAQWTALYQANRATVRTPSLIYVGQRLIIPAH